MAVAMDGVRTRVYCNGVLDAEDFPLEEVSDHLERADTIVWVDLGEPSKEVLDQLADELGLHELAIEDALSEHQRPKLDRYADHLFLSSHAVWLNRKTAELDETEIDAFISPRWLITVRKRGDFPVELVTQRWERSNDLAKFGVSYLLYGLLDVIIDGYFTVVTHFDEYYDEISDSLFNENPLDAAQQRHWFEMRRAMVRFHRLVVPMREVVSSVMRREHSVVPEELFPYYQDLYDHILRISDSSDSLRDLVGTIVETNLSLRDYRQNLVVKKVTSWAAIGLVPTVITGYYGMNVPYPGSGEQVGVVTSAVLMVVACAALYLVFRRRDWL
ncbi:MAG TPA: magnesium transporter CorA family protein [Acidimicrobiales bacterium]|nr:magnesium transporter CorA family protein [Acidimicrobiales bacterium]